MSALEGRAVEGRGPGEPKATLCRQQVCERASSRQRANKEICHQTGSWGSPPTLHPQAREQGESLRWLQSETGWCVCPGLRAED